LYSIKNYKKMGTRKIIELYIKKWEKRCYTEGIPDEAPFELENHGIVPSYRLICIALMKNPNNLEKLGIARTKCSLYNDIKRIEIYNRENKNKQLNLFM
jgi:predicted phosphoadenosine phosphosulfate sulfurtransferase